MERGLRRDLGAEKDPDKRSLGEVGVDRLMELGKEVEGNADFPEAFQGLELERTEDPGT